MLPPLSKTTCMAYFADLPQTLSEVIDDLRQDFHIFCTELINPFPLKIPRGHCTFTQKMNYSFFASFRAVAFSGQVHSFSSWLWPNL